jgi:hypothetical protein
LAHAGLPNLPGARIRVDVDGRRLVPAYRVKFLNTLLSSDGHPVSAVQRMVRVAEAETPEDACCKAQEQFCKLEHVEHWSHHAQCCEAEIDESPANNSDRQP